MLTSQPKPKRKHGSLEALLHFDDRDLKANRAGYLSQRQQRRLRMGGCYSYTEMLLGGVVALLFVFAPTLVAYGLALSLILGITPHADRLNTTLALLGGALFGTVISYSLFGSLRENWRKGRRFMQDRQAQGVASVQGRIQQQISHRGPYTITSIHVSGLSFVVSPALLPALDADTAYILYYAPATQQLLAAEPLPADDENPNDAVDIWPSLAAEQEPAQRRQRHP
ncbi:MAG: hypothetical protein MUE40_17625 [Anaerolineae bacterium]|nr:hypothetical protein [Anaerolineae bacterium]